MNKKLMLLSFLAVMSCSTECPKQRQELEGLNKKLAFNIDSLTYSLHKYQYFDISTNEEARDFFERQGIDDGENFVITKLVETNITTDSVHPLIDYASRVDKKFQINSIRVLNHRWVLCDFSDGLDWGELLLKIEMDDDKQISFKVFDKTLYVSDRKPY